MDQNLISELCTKCLDQTPRKVERCGIGQGNYVYAVECARDKYIFRCSTESGAYESTVTWLERLASIDVPVPKVIAKGKYGQYEYLILTYLHGQDIGLVYQDLSTSDKKKIAKEIVHIQNQVAALRLDNISGEWNWISFIQSLLERAETRIARNGYFDAEKVKRLWNQLETLRGYFEAVQPIPYLDDISSKNLLIHNGRISGIIDVDWIGIGDKLTYVALTNMALLNLEYDTDYVTDILEEMGVNETEQKAFLFYTLMYCADFMGERGMQFMDKTVEVNDQIIDRLNSIYDKLWSEWETRYLR